MISAILSRDNRYYQKSSHILYRVSCW